MSTAVVPQLLLDDVSLLNFGTAMAVAISNAGGSPGGSISAAQFIKRFVGDVAWAHLDIAGMAWAKKDGPVTPKGASAFGVRLLDRLVADHYES